MKTEYVKLAISVGWKYATASFEGRVSRAQLELWQTEFRANGGY